MNNFKTEQLLDDDNTILACESNDFEEIFSFGRLYIFEIQINLLLNSCSIKDTFEGKSVEHSL